MTVKAGKIGSYRSRVEPFTGYNIRMATPQLVKESPITYREALLPYVIAGVNMLAPTLAARDVLFASSQSSALLFITAITLIIAGLPISIYLRQKGYNRILLNILVLMPLLGLTWTLVREHPGFQIDWSNPIASAMAGEGYIQLEAMLLVFVLLAAGRAFLIISSEDMLQTPIPGLIIFLLTVVSSGIDEFNISARMILYMLWYFASSIYIISYEHQARWFPVRASVGFQRRLLGWTLIISLLLAPLAVACAYVVQPFNMYTLARAGSRIPRLPFRLFGGGSVGVGFENSLTVGGANWPAGKQEIMSVSLPKTAPANLLWRGGTYPTYLNGEWRADGIPFTQAATEPSPLMARSEPPAYYVTLDPVTESSDPGIVAWLREHPGKKIPDEWIVPQQISMEAKTLGGRAPLYGAYQFYNVISGDTTFQLRSEVGVDGCVFLANLPANSPLPKYEMESVVKPAPTSMTFKLKKTVVLPLPQQQAYLQVPNTLAKRLRQKAMQILSASDRPVQQMTALDKVRQFELYLGQHYKYTLTPKAPPAGVDPIDHFLYTSKSGYCVYFSGAMVLLCRSVGIPAREVVGFATGELPEAKAEAESAEMVTYRVTSDQAHAWAEVFLPDYGWYISDPTAGSTPETSLWGKTWDALTNLVTGIKNWFLYLGMAWKTNALMRTVMTVVGLVLVLVLVGILYLLQDRPPDYPKHALSELEAGAQVRAAYQRMHRWLRHWGVMKPDGYTAREFEQAFTTLNPVMSEPVRALSALYIRAQYGEGSMTDADARQAIDLLHALWRLARTERRRLQRADMES